MAAAPADFRPVKAADSKIKKEFAAFTLSLEPTVDILKDIADCKKDSLFTVGFALETDQPLENAHKKLKEKKLDMIVLNQVGTNTGFDSDTNQVTILRPGCEPIVWPTQEKMVIARKLLDILGKIL